MDDRANSPVEIEVLPATAERWPDLEALFDDHRTSCWCMFWRLQRANFQRLKGEEKKALFRDLTLNNEIQGVLAYENGQAVGWCAISPRENYLALENSRSLKRLDDRPVWSITCFFVNKDARRKGLMTALVKGAAAYARGCGAQIVEAYPIDMQAPLLAGKKLTGYSGYMGVASAFQAAGFVEAGRASETQLIMRLTL